jgi:DNA-binding NtrC family response regulator
VAHKGTLFLDEIGEMPLEMQVKLLRVLQSGEIQKVGSPRTVRVDVRIVAATNRDLREQVRKKEFREDLFYRLNVVPLKLPPLRERRDDIPLLVQHFIRENQAASLSQIKVIAADAVTLLSRYDWPGNVRELETVIKNASVFAEGEQLTVASFAHFGEIVAAASGGTARLPAGAHVEGGSGFAVGMTLAEIEKEAIIRTLEACKGNKKRTAEMLGIDRRTLYNKLDAYQLRLEKQASVVRS